MRHLLIPLLAATTALLAFAARSDDVGDLNREIRDEAALIVEGPAAAALLAASLEADARRRALADAPTDPKLFVSPKRAWIVLSEHAEPGAALSARERYARAGIAVEALALRDGGYDIVFGPEPISRARRLMKSLRRAGLAGPEIRLSGGAHYAHRLEPIQAK